MADESTERDAWPNAEREPQELTAVAPEEDFAALFEASAGARRVQRGQTIEGTIVAIGADVALVDIRAKAEAVIDVGELKDADGDIDVNIGDRITAMVVSTGGGIVLSRKGVRNAATQQQLEEAFLARVAVEGRVEQSVKGGYDVRIARERAFCPLSQIDIVRTTDPAVHVGRTYSFRIIEYKNGGKDVVVSRRVLLDEEQRAHAERVRQLVVPDAVLPGRVVSVRDFGAFVDLGGGLQGLLHVSDMGWSRATTPGAVVAAGDTITVKVLRVDHLTQKISLGLKQLGDDPWDTVATMYEVGQVQSGRVCRLAEFGAFVELEPGVEGLAHASTFPPTGRAGGWRESVAVGTTGAFEIVSLDVAQRRIALAMVESGTPRAVRHQADPRAYAPGTVVTGKVQRHEDFGVLIFLAPGRTGLMPLAETGLDRGADVRKAFPVGSDIDVVVLEVDAAGRRLRLSKTAVAEQRQRAELREYEARPDATAPQSLGSLADKLRGALDSRRK